MKTLPPFTELAALGDKIEVAQKLPTTGAHYKAVEDFLTALRRAFTPEVLRALAERITTYRNALGAVREYLINCSPLLDGEEHYPDWRTNPESGVGSTVRQIDEILALP